MAKVIVSGNLNTYGNAGQFETDRSTWGFSNPSALTITRSAAQHTAGIYAALLSATSGLSSEAILPCIWSGVLGKKYVVKAKVYTPAANKFGIDAGKFNFRSSLSNFNFGLTEIDYTEKTVVEATDTWVEVEISFEATGAPVGPGYGTNLCYVGGGVSNGNQLFVDQFEVYEYEEVADPVSCDVAIDEGATTVTDETSEGAADGSIDVDASSAGTIEYSKDGSAWQLASLFTGLTTGIFIMRAREQTSPICIAEYPFALNFAAVTHDFTTILTHESISGLHDGAIAITPSGSGGPFEYSIDAGVSWHSGNNFPDLAPGTYYVAVRNADGNSVVKVVVINAGILDIDKVYYSKNPITFSKAAAADWDEVENYRLYNDVRVEEVADSGNYVSKLKMELHPDADDQATFYLRQAFRDAFTFTPPTLNYSDIIRLTDRIKRFKNYSGELGDIGVTPGDLDISVANLVLYGGINKFHFPGLNFFGSYLPTKKKFLTWAPTTKHVDRHQEDYLNFYVYGNFTTLKLQLKVYFDDDTNETDITKSFVGSTYTQLYQIPAGPINSGALTLNPGKNPVKYELSLLDQTDSLISEVRTYVIERVKHPLTRYFMFLNSLGAFEVLRFVGQAQEETSFIRDVIQKFLPHNYTALDGEFATNNVLRTTQRSISSGFVKGTLAREWHEYLKDFMGSPIVYDVSNGLRYPVVISGGAHTTEDQNYERFIRVDLRNAYDNESFTPEEI